MPSSSDVGTKVVSGSRHRVRPYLSLVGRSRFGDVYRNGLRRRKGEVVVVKAPGLPGSPQVAFVAGRSVGRAVRRNRAKRRLRAAMERVPLEADTAYVVIAGRGVPDVEFERLVGWLRRAVGDQGSDPKEEPRERTR